jgi:4-carboxymuconolactone decarboxylase
VRPPTAALTRGNVMTQGRHVIAAAAIAAALVGGAAWAAAERFPEIPLDRMTPEQRQVADAITSGPRGRMTGPFNAWLRDPALADRLQKVGEHVRFKSVLPARLNEFAILITARAWTSQYEWYAHHPLALKAGLDPAVAAALADGQPPRGMKSDEAIVYAFCTELHRDKRVSDATYRSALDAFGETGVMDLVGVSGYYVTVSMTLNVAQVMPPPGAPLPLRALPR